MTRWRNLGVENVNRPEFAPRVGGNVKLMGPSAAVRRRVRSATAFGRHRRWRAPPATEYSAHHDTHRDVRGGGLRAAVFGISDGLVSNVSLVLGTAGAHPGAGIVRLAGLAGLFGGSFSMAAGEYISMRSQREVFEYELGVERDEIARNPAAERRELEGIYRSRGIDADTARELAEKMMADPATALDTHAREELGIDPGALGSPIQAALASFATFAVGALIPLIAFLGGARATRLSNSRSRSPARRRSSSGRRCHSSRGAAWCTRRCGRSSSVPWRVRSPTESVRRSALRRANAMAKKQRPQQRRRVLLVRHAQAQSRTSWQRDDFERPLSVQGRRQAGEIAGRFSSELVARVISSPAERCVATVAPLAEKLGREVEIADYLAEGSDGIESLELLVSAAGEIDEMATLVACSHGDICSEIVSGLSDSGLLDGKLSEVKKGGAIALFIEDGSVVSGVVLTPDALVG